MRLAYVLAILTALPSSARAEILLGVHVGGGLEGGVGTTDAVRPDAVAEAGLMVEYLPARRSIGIAATVEAVGRLTPHYEGAEEIKLDVMARWSRADRRFRGGLGIGVRTMTLESGASVRGYDLVRMDTTMVLARWELAPGAPEIRIEGYLGWTFGLYHDSYADPRSGDMEPVRHDVTAMTTTYVVGLRSTVSWR